MIEILQVFFQFLIFLLLSYFPFNNLTTPNLCQTNSHQVNFGYFILNILFLIFILLICSFIKINSKIVFFIFIIVYSLLLVFNFKKIIYEVLNKNNFFLKFFFLIINLLLFINLSYNIELGYDGLQIWALKANNFYNGYNYFQSFLELDNTKQYPHLGSYLWAFFWKNSLGDKEYFGRLFYTYLYVVSLFVLITSLKNYSESKKITILFLLLIFSFDTSLNGYQEYIIFALIIFQAKLLLVILNNIKDRIYNFAFVINGILICFIKNEGIFYSIFFFIIYYFFNKKKQHPILFGSIITIIISFQLYVSKIVYNLESVFQFSITKSLLFNENILSFYEIIKRLIYINAYIIHSLLKYPINLINFTGVIISIYYFKKMPENRPLLLFIILNIIFVFSIYLITPFPLEWHLQTSIKRLFLQTSGLYFFIIINILNRKILKF
jgi:hypothetical protein